MKSRTRKDLKVRLKLVVWDVMCKVKILSSLILVIG